MGFLQLNAMRLADIFSDDSNFRSYVTIHFVSVTEPQSLDMCFFSHSITNKEILASVPLSYFSYDGSDCFKTRIQRFSIGWPTRIGVITQLLQ
jgi:hypothetical protein